MRFFTFLLLLVFSCNAFAQQSKINFDLQAAIKKYSPNNQVITLFVKGNVGEIKNYLEQNNATYGLSAKGFIQVKIPVNEIKDFAKNNFVEYIEYTTPNIQLLNDTMLINNNVVDAHSGVAPLRQTYTGKGVLFGLIDTGIDITHPDFQDTLGNTRILSLWDQTKTFDGNAYGYGTVWDSSDINLGISTHHDPFAYKGHGTHVSGIAAGNGNAVNDYKGVAPDANIIAVGIDFTSEEAAIVDAIHFIYTIADALNMPCVINISLGSYRGSHDGTDAQAVVIDSMITAKNGRALVSAAGNAGALPFHLQHNINSDTTFTWFKYNASSVLGTGAVFYELWSDTADFNNVDFAFGVNLPLGSFALRNRTPFHNIQNRLGNFADTILNTNGDTLAIVETFGELQGDKYLLQVKIEEPDSNSYLFSLMTTGSGKLDIWSTNNGILSTSEMVRTGLPSATVYPNIVHYQLPDTLQTMVSSFTCSPITIAVGTYRNRKTYMDYDSTIQITAGTPGTIDIGSSLGPNRRNYLKPDISATGRYMMSSVPDSTINFYLANSVNHMWIAPGGKHMLKNGTSMASPAVAGVAALYFEKCPNASMAEIKNMIITNAKKDSFTGITPTFNYGNGKVDGFNTVVASNFNFSLGNDAYVCDGDSVNITAPLYSSYLWFNGDTTSNVYIDTTTSVYLEATNQSGCKGYSDTIQITHHNIPTKPIINHIGDDTLIISTTNTVQWYVNNNPISGANDTIWIAQTVGNYFAVATDSVGCQNYSDTVNVTIVGINEIANNQFNIYPNPVQHELTIEGIEEPISSIIIKNSNGQLVYSNNNISAKIYTINTTHFSSGVYFVSLISFKNTLVYKLFKY
ncbi:MAG: hypothetical protein CMD31_08130 [Flavobacteriales bacterium]|nr:hypothetical protein [Flavobacteriales bacterium]|tara:strand:+ start:107444 stop:110008 length:2565 start_codon:yes stop_codon:yes gene_type:complete